MLHISCITPGANRKRCGKHDQPAHQAAPKTPPGITPPQLTHVVAQDGADGSGVLHVHQARTAALEHGLGRLFRQLIPPPVDEKFVALESPATLVSPACKNDSITRVGQLLFGATAWWWRRLLGCLVLLIVSEL